MAISTSILARQLTLVLVSIFASSKVVLAQQDPTCPTRGLTVQNGELNRDVIEHSIWAAVLSSAAYQEETIAICNEISRFFDGSVSGFNFPVEIQNGWTDTTACLANLQMFSQNESGDLSDGPILDNVIVFARPITADQNVCYVAVRGTDGGLDALQNIDQTTSEVHEARTNGPPATGNCRAADGFQRALYLEPEVKMTLLNQAVQDCVTSCGNEPCTLITTGHSQGAAAGAIAGAYYHEYNPFVVTFAQPGTFASSGCDRIPSDRYLRFGNTNEYDFFTHGLLYDPVARLFLDGAFSDKSGHLVWLSAHNSGGVPHYPPNFREGLVSNFLLSLPFVGELHSVEAHAVRTSDLWRFVQNGDSFVPINGWNNDRMCLFSKECRGFCQTWWYTRVGRCAGGSAPSPSPPGTQPVQAVCQPEIYKIPTDGCQVTVLVDDVDAGSTVCAEKQISSTSFTGLQDQVVTLTVSLGTQVDTCTTVVKIQWEAPVLFCNETMTVSATSTGRSPFIEPEHLGFGFDPNGVARVVSFVGAEGGVPTDAYEKLLALYQEANATSNFREFYEIQAPALAAEYNLTDLYSDLTGVDLSANATGELNVGTYSITLTAQENTCLQTTSCVTPVTVVPFISTAAPTPNVRMPFKRPRYRPRVVDPKGKGNNRYSHKGMWKGAWAKGMRKSKSMSMKKGKKGSGRSSHMHYKGHVQWKGKGGAIKKNVFRMVM